MSSMSFLGVVHRANLFRSAATLFMLSASACATQHDGYEAWTALGYLTPGPTSEPEVIGVYATEGECEKATRDWMSRQVVGNPIFAECMTTDQN